MINTSAITTINAHIADALAKGVVRATKPRDLPAQFADPVVLSGATIDMQLAEEETFSPVAPVFRFETEAEALEAGLVGLNTGPVSHAKAPFGGVKSSGLGREGAQEGIEEYLETKAFHFAGLGAA